MGILDKFQLNNKVALVTGCKRGIGKAMAIALAEAGADIIGVSATLEKTGSEVEKAIISTDNTEALRNNPVRSEAILSRIPANRWGNPEDFAGPIVFLCSDTSKYMNGSVLVVDGGWMGR
jgi:NAD(P)-dependent dehydrogenase (short-subunit alcohol dehydrogenase family)